MMPAFELYPQAAAERFHRSIELVGECWLWRGDLRFTFNAEDLDPRKVAEELELQRPAPEGARWTNQCGVQGCVNPRHNVQLVPPTKAPEPPCFMRPGRQRDHSTDLGRISMQVSLPIYALLSERTRAKPRKSVSRVAAEILEQQLDSIDPSSELVPERPRRASGARRGICVHVPWKVGERFRVFADQKELGFGQLFELFVAKACTESRGRRR